MLFAILNAAQSVEIVSLNSDFAAVNPKAIDAENPGPGLAGRFVVPLRVMDDPTYQDNAPALVEYLAALPSTDLDPATIFAPIEDDV